MIDFDPRDYDDSRERDERDRYHDWKEPGAHGDLGDSHDRDHAHGIRDCDTSATAMTRMQARTSGAVRVRTTRNQNLTREIETRSAGLTATAITTLVMSSRVTWICPEDVSGKSFTIEIGRTGCAVRNPERWPRWVRFEWS